jgi:hypothetical protein
MRMPRFRFTVRRMMVAVAIVGFLLGAAAMWRIAASRGASAAYHAREAEFSRRSLKDYRDGRVTLRGTLTDREAARIARRLERIAPYHDVLARKYERAARYPWLPVEPDPPEPE